jgi:N-acyl-D-aspartate/D-glutamate deacylase
MVEEHDLKLRLRAGLSPMGVPLNEPIYTSRVYKLSTENELIAKLIEAAEARGGVLTVTQGVKATGAGFAQIEDAFREMMKSGYVRVGNDPVTGAVVYYFDGL